jgi:aspartate dehydrogenase
LGSAEEAIPTFPANIDVAAALSLAGIGADKTWFRTNPDPGCDKNIQEIEAEGEFDKLFDQIANVPRPTNP